ncbi:toprim domain-containing protein [Emticicia sp. W12TSBA100-4]|jgi:hypothetical protein|uniref:toprim domain-containing protein n=1 Tax=Emticicia sp. W12TSBA100-4 TaxID=3160965 RepID=UPI003306809F
MENNSGNGLLGRFRQEINIASYAVSKGWQINQSKSDKNCTVVQRLEDDRSVETILVRKDNQKGYRYITDGDPSDRGTIVDFLVKKENFSIVEKEDWAKIFAHLNNYMGNATHVQLPPSPPKPDKDLQKQVDSFHLNMNPLTDTRYLESRGLTENSFHSPEFQGQIFNSRVYGWKNISFPLRTDEAFVCAINRSDEQNGYRKEQWNRLTNERDGAMHISNLGIFDSKKIDKLIIAESPIDTLSYLELHHKAIREKQEGNIYIATAGTPANAAYATLQKVINQTQPEKIILAFDNDNGGYRHSLNIIGQISHPNAPTSELIKGDFSCIHKKEVVLRLQMPIINAEDKLTQQKQVEDKLIKPLESKIYQGSEDTIKYSILSDSAHHQQIEIRFPYHKNYLIEAEKGLVAMKGLEDTISLEHPKQKDYNLEICRNKPFVVSQETLTKESKIIELAMNRFARPIEALAYAQSLDTKDSKAANIYLEKYTAYQEYEAPELVATIKNKDIEFRNETFKKDIAASQKQFQEQQALEKQKLIAISITDTIFKQNELVLLSTHHREDNSLECRFQTVSKTPLQAMVSNDTVFMEKINAASTDKCSVVFKQDSITLLSVPVLHESLLLGEKFVKRNEQNIEKMDNTSKVELLKKDLNLKEITITDTQGEILAIADYSVKVQKDGEISVHKIEKFDLEKINQDGLDSLVIREELDKSTDEKDNGYNQKQEPETIEISL